MNPCMAGWWTTHRPGGRQGCMKGAPENVGRQHAPPTAVLVRRMGRLVGEFGVRSETRCWRPRGQRRRKKRLRRRTRWRKRRREMRGAKGEGLVAALGIGGDDGVFSGGGDARRRRPRAARLAGSATADARDVGSPRPAATWIGRGPPRGRRGPRRGRRPRRGDAPVGGTPAGAVGASGAKGGPRGLTAQRGARDRLPFS